MHQAQTNETNLESCYSGSQNLKQQSTTIQRTTQFNQWIKCDIIANLKSLQQHDEEE